MEKEILIRFSAIESTPILCVHDCQDATLTWNITLPYSTQSLAFFLLQLNPAAASFIHSPESAYEWKNKIIKVTLCYISRDIHPLLN